MFTTTPVDAEELFPDVQLESAEELKPITLSEDEVRWLGGALPINLALQKVIKNHYSERCVTCGKHIGNHSLKQAKRCVNEEWRKFCDSQL